MTPAVRQPASAPSRPAPRAAAVLAAVLLSTSPAHGSAESDLLAAEASFMAGDLAAALPRLVSAAASPSAPPVVVSRALYLQARIALLTGDFRRAKEDFERAAEASPAASRWAAAAGVADALLGGGQPAEALRRYRQAMAEAPGPAQRGLLEAKAALCERALGRASEARSRLASAMEAFPLLAAWRGREEEFFRSASIQHGSPEGAVAARPWVIVGPVPRGFAREDELASLSGAPRTVVARQRQVFHEFGPFADGVEAAIFAEEARRGFGLPAEVSER